MRCGGKGLVLTGCSQVMEILDSFTKKPQLGNCGFWQEDEGKIEEIVVDYC